MEASLESGAVCVPNITAAGRRRRQRFAIATALIGVAGFGVAVATGQGPLLRAVALGLPIAAGVASHLQVRRSTCVAHAYGGRVEHEDFSTTAAPPDESAASRRVAGTILRDAALIGAMAALAAAATSYVG
jgi:hypothetical protein